MALNEDLADQLPLRDVVLCCTSVAQDVRVSPDYHQWEREILLMRHLQTSLAETAAEMGAIHHLDLTIDVTHLLVGDINTPKYRYTAKDRPDIKALRPEFIDAVRDKWIAGDDVDVPGLVREFTCPVFFGLRVCITGFETNEERKIIEDLVVVQGASYHADLTKEVTHLIVARCGGAKYEYGRQWGIKLVGYKWLTDSLTRGMALDEGLYKPELPVEEQGIGAFKRVREGTSLGKRKSETEPSEEGGKRKLRKVASKRLEGHTQDLWQDISQQEVQVDNTEVHTWDDDSQSLGRESLPALKLGRAEDSVANVHTSAVEEPHGLFAGHYVLLHAFENDRVQRLRAHLEPNGATIVHTVEELEAASANLWFQKRCLLVPHAPPEARVDLPDVPSTTITVTEWWLERCLLAKRVLDPVEDALSRPFWDINISGFADTTISLTGYSSIPFRQTAIAIKLMGAVFEETLLPSTMVLICGDMNMKREKAMYATKHNITVVTQDWLWASLQLGSKAPFDEFRVKLPAFDPHELLTRSAMSSPAPSEVHVKVSGEHPAKRLSTMRRKHATPSLTLKPSKPSSLGVERKPVVEPTKPKQPARAGPFILEDDDEEDITTMSLGDGPPPSLAPRAASPSQAAPAPLQGISPNASQHRSERSSQQKPQAKAANDENANAAEDYPDQTGANSLPALPTSPARDQRQHLTSEMASILARQVSRSTDSASTSPAAPLKRKSRPLGRNLSTTSTRSGSASFAPAVAGAQQTSREDSNVTADGFAPARLGESDLPAGTQLGWEGADAEAARVAMGRKLGAKVVVGEEGRRVAGVGTVRDCPAAGSGKKREGGGKRKEGRKGK